MADPSRKAAHPHVVAAKRAGLVYVSDAAPGIRRRRAGRGFVYLRANGRRVADAATLARIAKLAIPPAYVDVWICADACGHLQATGRDARGRKQYRYHPQWHHVRDDGKYVRVLAFGRRLPALRRRLRRDLGRPGLPRQKVLAVVVTLLGQTLIRVGNEEYARSNRSYGLTTLRDQHVAFTHDGRATFSFRGKSGLSHDVALDDRRLARLVRHCQQLPGQQLFQYLDDRGRRQPVDSGQVNAYLRLAMGEEFTAKDFRTWAGTVRAVARLACTPRPGHGGEQARVACINAAVRDVADALGNTPAVCRKSYIHPEALAAWRDGTLHALVPVAQARRSRNFEQPTLALLRRRARSGEQRVESCRRR